MKNIKNILTAIALVFFLSLSTGCTGFQNRGQLGAAQGGVAGALIGQAIGHNTEATLIGAAVGVTLGYIVGNEMDKYDRMQLNHVYEHGVSGQASAWVNPDKGTQYRATPRPAYTGPGNKICREAEISAVIDGKLQVVNSTACRNPYGNWQLQ